ncbi:hypothetical protein BBP40_006031 [Aspergillus hancockii]|nr:hypothetical protein BBP40_006031 [Aspergillus hancockii]
MAFQFLVLTNHHHNHPDLHEQPPLEDLWRIIFVIPIVRANSSTVSASGDYCRNHYTDRRNANRSTIRHVNHIRANNFFILFHFHFFLFNAIHLVDDLHNYIGTATDNDQHYQFFLHNFRDILHK